jgi:hypothetical protein
VALLDPTQVDETNGSIAVSSGTTLNIAVGWTSLATGAVTGLVLGLWSFGGPVPVPEWIGDYNSLPRRLLRLGHIAFFGLGILNIMLARHLGRLRSLSHHRRLALGAMNVGNIFLPITLMIAAAVEPAKYLMSVPAMAVTIALVIGARAAILDARGSGR